jgi:hypothetical protein
MVNFSAIGIVHTLLITSMMHDALHSKNLQHPGLQILTLGNLPQILTCRMWLLKFFATPNILYGDKEMR